MLPACHQYEKWLSFRPENKSMKRSIGAMMLLVAQTYRTFEYLIKSIILMRLGYKMLNVGNDNESICVVFVRLLRCHTRRMRNVNNCQRTHLKILDQNGWASPMPFQTLQSLSVHVSLKPNTLALSGLDFRYQRLVSLVSFLS